MSDPFNDIFKDNRDEIDIPSSDSIWKNIKFNIHGNSIFHIFLKNMLYLKLLSIFGLIFISYLFINSINETNKKKIKVQTINNNSNTSQSSISNIENNNTNIENNDLNTYKNKNETMQNSAPIIKANLKNQNDNFQINNEKIIDNHNNDITNNENETINSKSTLSNLEVFLIKNKTTNFKFNPIINPKIEFISSNNFITKQMKEKPKIIKKWDFNFLLGINYNTFNPKANSNGFYNYKLPYIGLSVNYLHAKLNQTTSLMVSIQTEAMNTDYITFNSLSANYSFNQYYQNRQFQVALNHRFNNRFLSPSIGIYYAYIYKLYGKNINSDIVTYDQNSITPNHIQSTGNINSRINNPNINKHDLGINLQISYPIYKRLSIQNTINIGFIDFMNINNYQKQLDQFNPHFNALLSLKYRVY